MHPVNEILDEFNMQTSDIDDVELLGGGIRIPMVNQMLEDSFQKVMATHLNGDEAMCFGSAFIATNSSADFKVKQIFLTQHPQYDVSVKIQPLNPEDAMSKEDQLAEGTEEKDIINYEQEFKLFNKTDYIGKSKALNINYNRGMKIELLKHNPDGKKELLDTFLLKDVKENLQYEIDSLKRDQEREQKKKKKEKEKARKEKEAKEAKEANETKSEDGEKKEEEVKEEPKKEEEPAEEANEELPPIPTPKIKISIEFSRSGYMQITKANAG